MQFYFICSIATCKLCYLSCISIDQVFGVFVFWNLICLHFLKLMKLLSGFFFWQITQNTLMDYAARSDIVPTSWKKFSASRKYRLCWLCILNFFFMSLCYILLKNACLKSYWALRLKKTVVSRWF